MTLVLDASVVVKWLFNDPERESDTARATALMSAVARGGCDVLQPPHWLLEVAAVIARETPARAEQDVRMLEALALPARMDSAILARACRLSVDLRHHLFDTLYHAVALECGATLVTADERYYRKVQTSVWVKHLRDW
ncbi:MAG: type II toxin-antitoxin system VapC family toxin [Thiohalocapsa sp.]|nr:type II toxin-antitoxin system VapC family toxin [Thiohalocapsa sp.]MCF7990407.1 type II toxin-antitoxin system VapC family toxin [Thiohalocapsa sp.]